jgi:hypothetical protein
VHAASTTASNSSASAQRAEGDTAQRGTSRARAANATGTAGGAFRGALFGSDQAAAPSRSDSGSRVPPAAPASSLRQTRGTLPFEAAAQGGGSASGTANAERPTSDAGSTRGAEAGYDANADFGGSAAGHGANAGMTASREDAGSVSASASR